MVQNNLKKEQLPDDDDILEIKTRMPLPNSASIPPLPTDPNENQPKLSEKEKQQLNQIKCIKLYSETDKDDTPCVLVATTKGTLFRFKITDDIEEFKTGQVLH